MNLIHKEESTKISSFRFSRTSTILEDSDESKTKKSTCSRRTNTCVYAQLYALWTQTIFSFIFVRYFHLIFIRHNASIFLSLCSVFRCASLWQTLFLAPHIFCSVFKEFLRMDDGGWRRRSWKSLRRQLNVMLMGIRRCFRFRWVLFRHDSQFPSIEWGETWNNKASRAHFPVAAYYHVQQQESFSIYDNGWASAVGRERRFWGRVKRLTLLPNKYSFRISISEIKREGEKI